MSGIILNQKEVERMPVYYCKNCGYIFEQDNSNTCPECGKPEIRPALENEISEYNAGQNLRRKA